MCHSNNIWLLIPPGIVASNIRSLTDDHGLRLQVMSILCYFGPLSLSCIEYQDFHNIDPRFTLQVMSVLYTWLLNVIFIILVAINIIVVLMAINILIILVVINIVVVLVVINFITILGARTIIVVLMVMNTIIILNIVVALVARNTINILVVINIITILVARTIINLLGGNKYDSSCFGQPLLRIWMSGLMITKRGGSFSSKQ